MNELQHLVEQLAFALASHDIDLEEKVYFLAPEKQSEANKLLIFTNKYEKKLLSYLSKFQVICTDEAVKNAFENVLHNYHQKYDNGTWRDWTSEDMLLLLLQETDALSTLPTVA